MKKTKTICLLIVAVFCITLLSAPVFAAPGLSVKSLMIGKGQSFQLSVEGATKKVKWSSSKKKIAKVNKRGVVIAKKPGKTVITAKVGKKKYKCKVTVVPNPVNLDSYYNAGSAESSAGASTDSTGFGTTTMPPAYISPANNTARNGNTANNTNPNLNKTYTYSLSFDTSTKTVNSVANQNDPIRVPLTFTTDDPNFNEMSYKWNGMEFSDSNNGTAGGGKYVNVNFDLKNKCLTLAGSGSYSNTDENTAMTFTVKYAGKYNMMSGYSEWKTITFKVNYISEYVRVENRWMENLASEWNTKYGYSNMNPLQKLLLFTDHIGREHSYGSGGTFCDDLVTYHPNRYNEATGTCATSSIAIVRFAQHMLGYNDNNAQVVSAASGVVGDANHVVARVLIKGTWYYFEAGWTGIAPRPWDCYTVASDGGLPSVMGYEASSTNVPGEIVWKYWYRTSNGGVYTESMAEAVSHVTP